VPLIGRLPADVPADLSSPPAYDAGMRKPDPERIYLARRAAILSILTGSGASGERAETLVTAWEAEATARGLPRDSASFWSGAVDWIADRRWGGRRVMHGA
jgi:hypothetical protein